jgi:riboflavin kinase
MAERTQIKPDILTHYFPRLFSVTSTLPEKLCLEGKVTSGSGEGTKFTELPWVKKQIFEKLRFLPTQGTLNINLTNESAKRKESLKETKAIEITPEEEGFCTATCYRAIFMETAECAIIIPEVVDYPKHILEIIAPTNLRKRFQLKNGATVKVEVVLQ